MKKIWFIVCVLAANIATISNYGWAASGEEVAGFVDKSPPHFNRTIERLVDDVHYEASRSLVEAFYKESMSLMDAHGLDDQYDFVRSCPQRYHQEVYNALIGGEYPRQISRIKELMEGMEARKRHCEANFDSEPDVKILALQEFLVLKFKLMNLRALCSSLKEVNHVDDLYEVTDEDIKPWNHWMEHYGRMYKDPTGIRSLITNIKGLLGVQ